MPILANARHERFAQGLAKGLSATEAYAEAGFRPDRGNAFRLQQRDDISQRVQDLLDYRETVDARATERAVERLAITKEAVLGELAKIGFADIRKAVAWRGGLVREVDNSDGGDVLVIKEITNQQVRLIDSDKIDDDMAAAIAEVKQSPTGGLSIKLHDKQAALVNLGRYLGLFIDRTENVNINHDVSDELPTTEEWERENATEH